MQAILCEALTLPATPKRVTTYGQRIWCLFMLYCVQGCSIDGTSLPLAVYVEIALAIFSTYYIVLSMKN